MRGSRSIKAFFFDVDGTLTSGTLILGTEGEAYKIFHAQDGMALGLAHRMGYITGFITGRTSDIVRVRAEELKVDVLLMGVKNKVQAVAAALEKYRLCWEEVAFMGDDLNDLSVMKNVGLSGCPKDSVQEVLEISNFISSKNGGDGAVREFLEYIMKNNGIWKKILEKYSNE